MNNKKIINCIAYTRVSTEKQVRSGATEEDLSSEDFKGHSIKEQIESIQKFCDYKSNELQEYRIVEIFNDPGVSAKKIPFFDRPSGKEIREFLDAASGEIDYLVIKSLDRAFRDTEDGLATVRILEEYGVNLYVVEGNGDPVSTSSAMGKFIFTQLLSVDDFYVSKYNERTSEVLRSKQRNGLKLGRAPLGYKRNHDSTAFLPDYGVMRLMTKVYKYKVIKSLPNKEITKLTGLCKDQIRNYVIRYEELKRIPRHKRFYKARKREEINEQY